MVYFFRHVDGETRRLNPNGGKLPGKVRTGTPGNRDESPPGCRRETGDDRDRPKAERGSLGIVERPTGQQTERSATPPRKRGDRDLRIAPPEASAKSDPDRSWVPGPTKNGNESPERVEASAKAPSGFSRVCTSLSCRVSVAALWVTRNGSSLREK